MAEWFLENAQPFGKKFKEECDATRKVIKDINKKLNNFFILFSHEFHVSIPVECLSQKYSASLNQIEDESYKEELNKLKQGLDYGLPDQVWEIESTCAQFPSNFDRVLFCIKIY